MKSCGHSYLGQALEERHQAGLDNIPRLEKLGAIMCERLISLMSVTSEISLRPLRIEKYMAFCRCGYQHDGNASVTDSHHESR